MFVVGTVKARFPPRNEQKGFAMTKHLHPSSAAHSLCLNAEIYYVGYMTKLRERQWDTRESGPQLPTGVDLASELD